MEERRYAHRPSRAAGFTLGASVKRLAAFFGLALVSLGLLGVSSAAVVRLAGSLDPSFGSGGVVAGSGERIGGIAVQPDGRIVVAAFGSLARYLPDGSLDSSFGQGGKVTTEISADAVALQPDGKIVVAGYSGPVSGSIGSEFAVARYNPNGSLDAGFGTDGIAKTIIPETIQCGGASGAYASALAILRGGDVLVAGSVEIDDCYFPESNWWVLTRYTSDGSLDPTFGEAGIVQTAFAGQDGLGGIAVQPDGKIVATGSGGAWGHGGLDIATMALARYEPDGSLDTSFGTGGKVTTDAHLYYYGGPTALQRGKILVAGVTSKNGNTGKPWFPVLARYNASGSLDSTFGRHGFAEIKRQLGAPSAMLAQSDGKILIVEDEVSDFESSPNPPSSQGPSTLVRLLPDGRLDQSFGRGGLVSLGGAASSLASQTDKKILVGRGDGNAWALARLIGGNNCVVPGLRSTTVAKATTTLRKSYCRRGHLSRRFSSEVRRGDVISTAPGRGARLPGGTKIDLVVSRGKRA